MDKISKRDYLDMQIKVLAGYMANPERHGGETVKESKAKVDELLKLNDIEVGDRQLKPKPNRTVYV